MKKLSQLLRATVLLMFLIGTSVTASAYDFESGGIYYKITSSTNMTAAVTYYNKTNNTYSGTVSIPEKVTYNNKTYYVTAIGDYAFVGCTGLIGINFTSQRLTSIGNYAFSGCNGLTSFTFPSHITSVGNNVFNACYGITKITISAATTSISLGYGCSKGNSHGLFEDCPLVSVYVNRPMGYKTTKAYGYSPFAMQTALKQITFGQNITSVPTNFFYGNTAITSYTVPSHIKVLDDYAFNGFVGAKTIKLAAGTTTISNYAFYGCTNLTSFDIPTTVSTIGQYSFAYSGLASLVIPSSVTSFNDYAFIGCTALKERPPGVPLRMIRLI